MSLNIEKYISNSILRTLFVMLGAVGIKIVQLSVYHNSETGLLVPSAMSTFIQVIVIACILYITYEYYMLTVKVNKLAGYIQPKSSPITGLTFVLLAVCFLFQGIMNTLTNLTMGKSTLLSIIISILTILSAVIYAIQGFKIVGGDYRQNFFLNVVPVLWSIAVLMNIMITYPTVASMQSNISKVVCCSLLVLFMYYNAKAACGYDKDKLSVSGVFFRMSFSCLTLIFVLPYCIMYIFKIRDSINNVPYIALMGLTLYGFIILIQYMVLAVCKIEKKQKRK